MLDEEVLDVVGLVDPHLPLFPLHLYLRPNALYSNVSKDYGWFIYI